jgi:molybdopterin-guanine dinucleotide biosynthesis protein A
VSDPASYAVVVLAGGTSRRMGGGDKTALDLRAGQSVLGHLVSSLDTSVPVVVVGPSRPLERSVTWARESPVGGGPLAGLAAGLAALPAQSDDATWVVVIAGDQPFAAMAVPALLAGPQSGIDGVVAVDQDGRAQPLLAAYRRSALAAALSGPVGGRSMHSLLDRLVTRPVEVPPRACLDVDDDAALRRARELAAPSPPPPSH